MKVIAMIPARLGSQRLKKKNLKTIEGVTLLGHAIRKCFKSEVFDEVWVNSESEEIGGVAKEEGAQFYERSSELANNQATSEDFVYDFLKNVECDYVVQVHSIAPLLSVNDIKGFVNRIKNSDANVFLSYEPIQIELSYKNSPVNFTYSEKTNSQELEPAQRISWSITAWSKQEYLKAYENGECATYAGKIDYVPVGKLASHVVKTQEDLDIAAALFKITG